LVMKKQVGSELTPGEGSLVYYLPSVCVRGMLLNLTKVEM